MKLVRGATKSGTFRRKGSFSFALAAVVLGGALGCARSQSAAPSVPASPSTATTRVQPPAPAAIDDAVARTAAEEEEELTHEIPTECAPGATQCTPPAAFVESACRSKYPELALVLFSKGTPWQRAYVKAEWVEPVNVYGGERSNGWLYFGEEVLVLRERTGGPSGVTVSGPTDVDILRWDGTCATIRKEMLVPYVTAPMTSVRIFWKYLDTNFQEALARDELVQRAEEAQRKACRSSSIKNPTQSCDKVMKKLTDTIVLAVKNGAELPSPTSVPAWKR